MKNHFEVNELMNEPDLAPREKIESVGEDIMSDMKIVREHLYFPKSAHLMNPHQWHDDPGVSLPLEIYMYFLVNRE